MTVALVLTALALGLRHGVDWDHIAAIADLTGTAENRRRGFVLSLLYALGHAIVVFALGSLAILFGMAIPDPVASWMGRIVGFTLIGLGLWVIVELFRQGRSFRLRSRWMLVLNGTFAGFRRVRGWSLQRRIAVDHDHDHDHGDELHSADFAHDHSHLGATVDVAAPVTVSPAAERGSLSGSSKRPMPRHHHHRHHHELALPNAASARYGSGTAAGIGMLHGVGIESPTQIAVFVASTSVVGGAAGLVLLLAWVTGLVVANSVLAIMAGAGLIHAERNFAIYATLAVVVAVASVAIGALLVTGLEVLPPMDV